MSTTERDRAYYEIVIDGEKEYYVTTGVDGKLLIIADKVIFEDMTRNVCLIIKSEYDVESVHVDHREMVNYKLAAIEGDSSEIVQRYEASRERENAAEEIATS